MDITTVKGTVRGVAEMVEIRCRSCGVLVKTWTNVHSKSLNSKFMYNTQAVRGALGAGMHCKSLRLFLANLGLSSISHTTFQRNVKLFAEESTEVLLTTTYFIS